MTHKGIDLEIMLLSIAHYDSEVCYLISLLISKKVFFFINWLSIVAVLSAISPCEVLQLLCAISGC
jgi:hypothetical protein